MSSVNSENFLLNLDQISSLKSVIFLVLTGITRLSYRNNDKQNFSTYEN